MSKIVPLGSAASRCVIDPRFISVVKQSPSESTYLDAAQHWYRFGFNVIPIVTGTKKTAVKWDPWLDGLSAEKIAKYWLKHPDHEVGFIVGNEVVVFDADTPQSLTRLCDLEKAFDVAPALTVKTRKGEHHFFRLAKDTTAKSDSHSSEKHPERIDVKTGRALIVLPPTGGREVLIDAS